MFASFIRPARAEFILFFLVAAIALGFGRFWGGDGGDWTRGCIILSAVFFMFAAVHWPALHVLDVPARRWLGGALSTAVVWSALMSVIATAAGTVMQRNSPYYASYDWFLDTDGSFHHVDTNGEPYVLEGMGITVGSVVWTFVLTFVVFLIFTVLGLAVGLSGRRWKQIAVLGAAGVLGLVVLIGISIYVWTAMGPTIRLDHWARLAMTVAVALVPIIASWWAISRTLKSPWS